MLGGGRRRPSRGNCCSGRGGKTIEPTRVKSSALTADQQAMLLEVIGVWVNIVEPDAAFAEVGWGRSLAGAANRPATLLFGYNNAT